MAAKVKARATVKETVATTVRVVTEETVVTPSVVPVVSPASVETPEATLDRPSEASTSDGPSELSERGKTFSQRRTQGRHF
jgi:hypothetical protein